VKLWGILLLLLCLLTAVGVGQADPGRELTVLGHYPRSSVSSAFQIRIDFSKAVAALGSEQLPPVHMDPAVEGKWRWISDRTLIFQPRESTPHATLYQIEIPAGIRSLSGARLEQPVKWSFASSPVRITYGTPHADEPQGSRPSIALASDQRVDGQALLPWLSLSDSAREYPLTLDSSASAPSKVVYKPVQPLPLDSKYTVTLHSGAPSAEGPLRTERDQTFRFSTVPPLRFVGSRSWRGGAALKFNNPLDPKTLLPGALSIKPEAAFVLGLPDRNAESIVLNQLTPGQEYQITLRRGGVRDIHGQALDEDCHCTIQPPSAVPYAEYRSPRVWHTRPIVTLAPARPTLQVVSQDVSELAVEVFRVSPADWFSLARSATASPGKSLKSWTLAVSQPPPERVHDPVITSIDLGPFLENGMGHFVVGLHPKGGERVRQWVQVSNLGLVAWRDLGQTYAWVASFRDGQPVSGARVQIERGSLKAQLDADSSGLAHLQERVDYTEGLLTASVGRDVVLLPSRPPTPQPWVQWAIAEPQGLYRPGETVRVKGVLRTHGYSCGEISYALGPRNGAGKGAQGYSGKVPILADQSFLIEIPLKPDATPGEWNLRLASGVLSERNVPLSISEYRLGSSVAPKPGVRSSSEIPTGTSEKHLELVPRRLSVSPNDELEIEVSSPFPVASGVLTCQDNILKVVRIEGPRQKIKVPVHENLRPNFVVQLHLLGKEKDGSWVVASG